MSIIKAPPAAEAVVVDFLSNWHGADISRKKTSASAWVKVEGSASLSTGNVIFSNKSSTPECQVVLWSMTLSAPMFRTRAVDISRANMQPEEASDTRRRHAKLFYYFYYFLTLSTQQREKKRNFYPKCWSETVKATALSILVLELSLSRAMQRLNY